MLELYNIYLDNNMKSQYIEFYFKNEQGKRFSVKIDKNNSAGFIFDLYFIYGRNYAIYFFNENKNMFGKFMSEGVK